MKVAASTLCSDVEASNIELYLSGAVQILSFD